MKVWVNEKSLDIDEGFTLSRLKGRFKPEADLAIYNGFPLEADLELQGRGYRSATQKGRGPGP